MACRKLTYQKESKLQLVHLKKACTERSRSKLTSKNSIKNECRYLVFGDSSLRTYSSKRYQFIGREKDAESGLHYWSARYYSSWTCRFVSVDKMASSYAHLTPYNYADNDPINDFDIDGNQNNNTQQTPSGGGDGGGKKSTVTIGPNETVTHTFPHQAETPANIPPMEKMQPKGFANDALQTAPPQAREPISPRQAFLEKSANLTKQSPNQGSIDYPSNDIRSKSFQAFDTHSEHKQIERAMQLGTDLGSIATGALKLLAKNFGGLLKGIKSLFKKSDDAANGSVQLSKSVSGVMGKSYKAVGEVTAQIKNTELLSALNKASKGNWTKVYEAGLKNGNKIEVHYFRNNTTGKVFDVKTKYTKWHQKAFKNF